MKQEATRAGDLEAELARAREQQAAVAAVMRTMSAAPTDLDATLDAILTAATRLCHAAQGFIYVLDGDVYRMTRAVGIDDEFTAWTRGHPIPVGDTGKATSRAALLGAPLHIPDVLKDKAYTYTEAQVRGNSRTILSVPLMKDGVAVAVISMWRTVQQPFTDEEVALVATFADQALIAFENVRLASQTRESLEQQTAISDVLAAIGRATNDVSPVFRTILEHAGRLCDAERATIALREGERVVVKAGWNIPQSAMDDFISHPFPVDRTSAVGRAIVESHTVMWDDISLDEELSARAQNTRSIVGSRSVLVVPLLREGIAIGAINLRRNEVRPFTPGQRVLVETFAEQATLAIENVRLFNETNESLEQQTATGEILRVISSSPTDVQPVLQAIADSAARFCEAEDAAVGLVIDSIFSVRAHYGPIETHTSDTPISSIFVAGRAIVERRTIDVPDLQAEAEQYPVGIKQSPTTRAILATPMMRGDTPVGAIILRREAPGRFTARQVELVETFARQGVIAIENVRLFNETKESLGQQTAVADVLASISRSAFDINAVMQTIVERSAALIGAETGLVARRDGDVLVTLASYGPGAPRAQAAGARTPIDNGTLMGRAVLEARRQYVEDATKHPDLPQEGPPVRLIIPFVRDGVVTGVLSAGRRKRGPFTEREVHLLEVFADQAAIAIDNVRLFNETKESLERQTATAEILQIISSSPTDITPVFEAIANSAARYCDAANASVALVDRETFQIVGNTGDVAFDSDPRPLSGTYLTARAIRERRTLHTADLQSASEYPDGAAIARRAGYRAIAVAPMVRGDRAVGAVTLRRATTQPFSDRQIQLLETFAAQAALAVENVRLFNETKESLEQQTATADLLKVVSRATSELQPVFDTIVESAVRVCHADYATFWRPDGDAFVVVAGKSVDPSFLDFLRTTRVTPERGSVTGRALLERSVVHLPDVFADAEIAYRDRPRPGSARSALGIPILRGGEVIALLAAGRHEVRPFSSSEITIAQTFADQAAIAIENVRLFNETKEALERQTATSEILGLIARSPSDVQPVLDAIAENAARVCGASDAHVYRVEGETLQQWAHFGPIPGLQPGESLPLSRGSVSGRSIIDRRPIHMRDAAEELDPNDYPISFELQRRWGYRTILIVPLVRQDVAIGAIAIRRMEVRPFSPKQIELLETFAQQAVIAIEDVRLFNETNESLARQTAISEILRAMAASPTDERPVLDTIARSAVRFCGAEDAAVSLRGDSTYRFVAHEGDLLPDFGTERPLDESTVSGRAIVRGELVSVTDIQQLEEEFPRSVEFAKKSGQRAMVSAPMLREGRAIGAIVLRRRDPKPFTPAQIELLRAFADQAVIAIENVRLFNETKESLEQQRAIADILRVISESPTDIQPVLDAIARSATRYCGAEDCGVALVRADGMLEQVAQHGPISTSLPPWPVDRGSVRGRAVVERRVVHVEDMLAEPEGEYPIGQQRARDLGQRTVLAAPLLRKGVALGAIALRRAEYKPFSEKQIELLRTFADQAAIAIENVRLFNETKEALERQTAISEILRAITSSPTDVLPVFDAVAESAIRFCGAQDAVVMLPHGQELHVAAHRGTVPVPADLVYPLDGTSGNAVAFMEARVVHMPDLEDPATVERFPRGTATGHRFGFRAAVVAPLLREGKAIGCITLRRFEAGPFSGHQIDLLRTFADQAAIAIENVRLFNETKEALEQQTAIADILRVISASPSDTQPVLDAIAASATKFAAAEDASVLLIRDGALIPAAHHGPIPMPLSVSVDRDSVSGRAVIDARTVHAADVTADDEFPNSKRAGLQDGQRTVLAAPLIRDGTALGVIVMRRREPRPFTEQQLRLAQTFADQAAIAIENVRLFNQTKASLERQTATAEILRAISASPTDVQPVLDAIVTNAVRYCGGEDAALHLIHDGRITGWAHAGPLDESERDAKIMQLPLAERTMIVRRDRAQGRAILDRVTIHMPDVQDPATIAEFPDGLGQGRAAKLPFRAAVVAPLRRQHEAIGTIMLRRTAPGPFTAEQIALVETFAAQAVIAIENVRLFNETKESLERQTATSEVLKVISRSAQDLQPVFQAILESATRLSGTTRGGIYMREGDELRSVVHIGLPPERAEYFDTHPTAKITMDDVVGRALLTREALQVADASNDPSPEGPSDPTPRAVRPRTVLAIPMVQEGEAIGVIALTRGEVRPFSPNDVSLVTTFADQAVIAIENVRLFNETKEALERQTATTEILQVISSSPTDIQPVFDVIARSAARYCAAENATVFLVEDDSFRPVAKAGDLPFDPVARPLSGSYLQARVINERLALRVTDIQSSAEYPDGAETGRRHGFHAIAVAPMIRGDRAIGTVSLRRVAAEPFSDRQFELLQTFAAQAAIAVENVRLFNETKEALERQTAVSEVLRVISRSAFDLKPVLDTVVETAARLCDADLAWIRSVEDGAFARQGAWYARSGQPDEQFPTVGTGDRPNPGSVVGRTLATRKPLQFADVAADRELLAASRFARETRSHSLLSVPLLREDEVVGVIVVSRLDVRPFSERQLQLLQTFADQAAIAIQNVRLFEETRAALERQTAISDVLKTISRSVFDLVPTLQAVIDNAARLAEADVAWLSERSAPAGSAADHVGREFDIAAMTFVRYGRTPELLALFGRTGTTPQRVGAVPQRSIMARIYAEGKTVHVHDMLLEPELAQASPTVKQTGARTVLAVPVVSEGKVIAGLIVARLAVRPFDAREIQLVETFADQAGIAIQNVRLFSDVQQKSRELEVANRHKSEFLANMSHELRTPLNAIIGFSEVMLQGIFGALNDKQREYQEDVLSSGKHLLLLINDILDLSKIEAGRMELEISTFSLANALDSGLTIVRERAGRHGITLQAVLPAGLPVIEADERKVKQILFNLLSNAVKFTPDGGRVEVRARVEDGNVRVDVQDTGIGIAPEDHARVFEEFQQVGRERSREGTGLGLTLSRRFVELQGGRIWLESTPGKGSTFSFTLPLRRPAEVKG